MNYAISDLITRLQKLAEHIGLTDSQWTALAGYLTLLGLIVSVVLVLLGVAALGAQLLPIIAEHKRKTALRNSELASVYQIGEIRGAVEYYIEPDCSPLDPASEEDLRQIIPVRTPLLRTLDGYLAQGGRRKYVLLLADSGMGKTSFLLNYFARHQLNHPSKNRGICLIPLNTENVEEKIKRLSDAKNTGIDPKEVTILLDAFDEDPAAQSDHRARLVTLMKACESFKNVVVTCRTQFFSSDEEIPKEPGVAVFAPHGAGDSGAYKFHKLYIAPFSDHQVSAYIKRRFPFWRFTHRRQAMDIVTTVSELSVRPMLLVAIPEIVKGRIDARHLVNLYEFLVEGWLEREKKVGIRKEELRPFSEFVAVFIYLNRSRKKKPERLSRDQLRNFMSAHASAVDSWKFEQRSFLNRDASGNLKFAHRSIMEYLFVSAFFNGEAKCLHNEWTDLMKHLFFSFVSSRGENALKTLDSYSLADFGKTKLFPCFSLRRRSDVAISIDGKELLAPLSLKLAPGIPTHAFQEVLEACNVAQRWLLIESVEAGMPCIRSYALDLTWHIPVDPRASAQESYDLFALDRYGIRADPHISSAGAPQQRKRVRLPSVHEFDFISKFSAGAAFLGRDWLYWTSDSTAAKEPVLVSLGIRPLNKNYLRCLGPKQRILPWVVANPTLYVYALEEEPVMLRDNMLRGVPIWVSIQG
ncbi:MAG: hypothetical protein A3F74_19485 [Betaproteobacteria bacterium RIFCSPLOWO2_12_FULL_62_58]|nr:MAG: hypothetical protein A3F74_19485 [Betaproteobacteria bacterium RIFCSPLOWO2_12_FULL_62_58]